MKKMIISIIILSVVSVSHVAFAKEKEEKKNPFEIPNYVVPIAKENTYTNKTEDVEEIEPSTSTKELLETTDVSISNPKLIQLLNETSIKPSPIGIGYRGMISLGRWPLHYESLETLVNWEYQEINRNELNNIGGEGKQFLSYHQEERREIIGALTSEISQPEDIRTMMLHKAKEKSNLPLTYETMVGERTTTSNTYNVAADEVGVLDAYAPAVHEKGKVTFGEVYIELKGNKKSILVKNVIKQGTGAWIPIQDHVTLSFSVE